MRILVAGTGNLGAAILEPLLEGRHQVAGVVLNGKRTRGRFERYRTTSPFFGTLDPTIRLAKRWGLPLFWLDPSSKRSVDSLARLEPDLLITCGFGIILDGVLLSLPRIGCMNVHSSLLPKHRGPMPFNRVILAGETQTGVTFHVTTRKIDAGDVLDQRAIPVTGHDTALSVYRRCCELARHRIAFVVDQIDANGLQGMPQNEAEASYDPPLAPADLRIDWSRPASEIDRVIRAGMPFLSAHFVYRGRAIAVERALWNEAPVDAPPGTVVATEPHITVATGKGIVVLVHASLMRPVVWPWPNGLSRPAIGAVLE